MLEFFTLDATNYTGGPVLHFHAGTNSLSGPVTWQGQVYTPLPIAASGFDMTTQGSLPRPQLQIANIDGLISGELIEFNDLVGSKITRKRTHAKFLDAVNFPGGVNPTADPTQSYPDDVWYVEQKMAETRFMITWELSSAMDLWGVQLPQRQVIQNSCTWIYRSAECSWTGGFYDINDNPTSAANDQCSKRLSGCKCRFGGGVLPFGGFPGATSYDMPQSQ